MKKYRWTALLLALVLAAGVCAGCGKKQTDAPAQDNQIQTNPDEVTAVTYTNGTITLRFSLQDGRWCWSDDKTFPLDGSYITALLADVQGGPPISITEEDLESYGLGGVTKYIEITTAEKTVTYYLGDPCDDGSSYLSRDDDESTVYRAPDDLSARLDRSIYDMAQLPTLPALTADVLRSVTIAASGAERTFTVDGGVWTEGGADVSAETASLADVLSQPAFSGCVDYHPGSGAAAICGLDPANATLTAVYAAGSKEATFTLLLGGARRRLLRRAHRRRHDLSAPRGAGRAHSGARPAGVRTGGDRPCGFSLWRMKSAWPARWRICCTGRAIPSMSRTTASRGWTTPSPGSMTSSCWT